jgi:hypothetical protein
MGNLVPELTISLGKLDIGTRFHASVGVLQYLGPLGDTYRDSFRNLSQGSETWLG